VTATDTSCSALLRGDDDFSICALAGCAAIANAATPSVTAPDRQNRGA
jgi:hypothetical protein